MGAACNCECEPNTLGGENRNVYTKGSLLETVQRSNMFPDCKTFVDMKMRYLPERVLADFELFSNCRRNDGSLHFLQMFVDKHFEQKGSELENVMPKDWKAEPPFLNKICDKELKQFGIKLNELWKELCWRLNDDVKQNPEYYSSIYVPNPFIIPGGKFIELYYWDSYWIIIGLLWSGMHETAKGIIDNFLFLINQYGFIPSGGRIYYSGRSHPPLLIHMMKAYVDCTNDEKYAIESLPLLETEFNNFLDNHKVEVEGNTMYVYRNTSTGPRPEAFREDTAISECLSSDSQKEELYSELKAACESGMDFSSRWFISENGTNEGNLKDTKTSSIVPVDLNCILFRSSKILKEFHIKAGNTQKAEEYQDIACDLAKGIRDLLWNEEAGIWLDYDLANNKPRPYFCVSNFYPLWTRAFPIVDREKIGKSVITYIENNKLDSFLGGVPTTLNHTNLRWDYPYVWPCMMYIIIEGLDNLGTPESKALSKCWGHRWIKSNYESYRCTGYMFDKYNCENFGAPSACGEYENQTGYGSSNGIAIHFLSKYGKDLCLDDTSDGSKKSQKSKKDCVITSDIRVVRKKRELIITSEDNMNKLAKAACGCEQDETNYHTPIDESPCPTPKSNESPCNGNKNMSQYQSEKSEQLSSIECPNADDAVSNIPCQSNVLSSSSPQHKVEAPGQICQYCGQIMGTEPIEENVNQMVESEMQQEESMFCACQSQAADIAEQEVRQQDKSTSLNQVDPHLLLADKSTCVCVDDEAQKLDSICNKSQENQRDRICSVCSGSDNQSESRAVGKTKIFPLSDPTDICSEAEMLKPKPTKEKECP